MKLQDTPLAPILFHKLTRYGLVIAVIAFFVFCGGLLVPGTVTVSNSVNGRELPIYCVETPEKKVALLQNPYSWGWESLPWQSS